MMWRITIVAVVFAALPALAKAPPGQGRKCTAKQKCEASLTCVDTGAGSSRCELLCKDNSSCPEDQRCIRDGNQKICRPINDGVGL